MIRLLLRKKTLFNLLLQQAKFFDKIDEESLIYFENAQDERRKNVTFHATFSLHITDDWERIGTKYYKKKTKMCINKFLEHPQLQQIEAIYEDEEGKIPAQEIHKVPIEINSQKGGIEDSSDDE